MQKRVCIINFSAPELEIAVLADRELETINFSLPWDVGFRQEDDGTLVACFGEAFDRLDSNNPKEIQFPDLDVFFKDITDTETLASIFTAYFEEIFRRRLPEEALSVYIITPYQWKSVHRQQLRKILKSTRNYIQVAGLNPPNVILRGMISQILCLTVCYRADWEDLLANTSELQLFLVDCARQDLILYQLDCNQLSNHVSVELSDILRFPDFFINRKKKVSDVQRIFKTVEEKSSVAIGFSDMVKDNAKDIIDLLQSRCSATFLEPQEEATLMGGTKLIQQFAGKSVAKPLHFVYNFCFGVQLPDGKWIELVPKTWTPPYHRKKAFRVTGTLNKIYIPLFCGLSLSDNSDVHHLATIEIDYSEDFPSRNSHEFLLSVTLNDVTHGTYTVHSQVRESRYLLILRCLF
jgi:hypothetical protein